MFWSFHPLADKINNEHLPRLLFKVIRKSLYWNERIKTEFSGISWIPNLLVMSLFTLCTLYNKKYQYAVNFTPSKLQWLMVTSKTWWDTNEPSEANTAFRANCLRLGWLIKGLLCRPPLFKEVRTCRKTFEIPRAKQTCKKGILSCTP